MFDIAIMLGIIFTFSYFYFGPQESTSKNKTDRDADRIYFGAPR